MYTCDECGADFDEDGLEAEFGYFEDGECLCAFCNSDVATDQEIDD
ncbi:hypothetical protein [Pseudomonas sp. zfem005]|nr:hypothetical protein [Pseudomonas sp. zfem005]MDU9415001.1 hypothetical protein [Pseudomonas sp. zfem005]